MKGRSKGKELDLVASESDALFFCVNSVEYVVGFYNSWVSIYTLETVRSLKKKEPNWKHKIR